MNEKLLHTRVLGTLDIDTPEVREQIQKRIKLAAGGAYPYAIRELMKQCARQVIAHSTDVREKETAQLLICYSWWSRALEGGIPKKHFEEYMTDHLNYLDKDKSQDGQMEKWKQYGG